MVNMFFKLIEGSANLEQNYLHKLRSATLKSTMFSILLDFNNRRHGAHHHRDRDAGHLLWNMH